MELSQQMIYTGVHLLDNKMSMQNQLHPSRGRCRPDALSYPSLCPNFPLLKSFLPFPTEIVRKKVLLPLLVEERIQQIRTTRRHIFFLLLWNCTVSIFSLNYLLNFPVQQASQSNKILGHCYQKFLYYHCSLEVQSSLVQGSGHIDCIANKGLLSGSDKDEYFQSVIVCH